MGRSRRSDGAAGSARRIAASSLVTMALGAACTPPCGYGSESASATASTACAFFPCKEDVFYGHATASLDDEVLRTDHVFGFGLSTSGWGPFIGTPREPDGKPAPDAFVMSLWFRSFDPDVGFAPGTRVNLATDAGGDQLTTSLSAHCAESPGSCAVFGSHDADRSRMPEAAGSVVIHRFEPAPCKSREGGFWVDVRFDDLRLPRTRVGSRGGADPTTISVSGAFCNLERDRCQSLTRGQ